MRREGITVIIPTRDEALHVGRCVASVRALGRVVVVDSGSRDGTQAMARAHGAEVVEHAWPGHAAQKNWALDHCGIETEWVLFLDCDEYLTPAAVEAIREATASDTCDGWYLPRAYVFFGRRLRHAWWYPDYQLRLFRAAKGRFEERKVHEHAIVDGPVGTIETPITHENLKGLSAFIDRHNRYSELEADELLAPAPVRKPGAWTGTWADRRRALKDHVWFRLPGRPLLRFLWMYVVKRGFLDGRRGLLFCSLIAMYEMMIEAKLMERRLMAEQGRRVSLSAGQRASRPAGQQVSDIDGGGDGDGADEVDDVAA